MSENFKSQQEILQKLGIEQLNAMQEEALTLIQSEASVVLLSPTGTGKTLAFSLPILQSLDTNIDEIQALILVPSRELAIQIEQVIREMGTGFKVNAVYGGQAFTKDRTNLQHKPAILIGTPGRVADHLRRNTFTTEHISTLVLDEFDKSLEIGFEADMKEILEALHKLNKKILTSATEGVQIPKFVRLKSPAYIDFLQEGSNKDLKIKALISPDKDKLETLGEALSHLGNQNGIIFCNFKESIQRVSDFLEDLGIEHGCFYGGMEQRDRERSLIKFRNGTYQLLIATDLAARGIDVPELNFIIHYHLPLREYEFTHRNGRTARMHKEGTAYVLKWQSEKLPDFIGKIPEAEFLTEPTEPIPSDWATLFISGGRKDKISKGDIAGLLFKIGELKENQVGVIELKQDCAFVSVDRPQAEVVAATVNNTRLKKKKVRVQVI